MSQPVIQHEAPVVVTGPRAGDAVGGALRDAYRRQPMPKDMLTLLGRLNSVDRGCRELSDA